jgi:AhpD family alkylhydroperoxidase
MESGKEGTAMKLDHRTAELIAIGASVAANCRGCLEFHVCKAGQDGADKEAIGQAVDIGKMVRRGAAAELDRLAASLRAGEAGAATSGAPGCGCR